MVDALISSDARQNLTFFASPILRYHKRNGLTNCLTGRVAEDSLSTAIPACNDAIEIFTYNRVVAGLDYGGQPTQSLLAFAKRSFDLRRFARNSHLVFLPHSDHTWPNRTSSLGAARPLPPSGP